MLDDGLLEDETQIIFNSYKNINISPTVLIRFWIDLCLILSKTCCKEYSFLFIICLINIFLVNIF
jgi:hypothetical protein